MNEAIAVSDELNEDLLKFYHMAESLQEMDPMVKLFWEEQVKAFGANTRGMLSIDKSQVDDRFQLFFILTDFISGMKWHPKLVKFAVLIHQQSPALYRTLRSMGVVRLPGI